MSWSLIASINGGGYTGAPITVGPIDTTGADFIVMVTTNYGEIGAGAVSDSESNTWTRAAFQIQSYADVYLDFTVPSSVSNSHTFTTDALLAIIQVIAWSGANVDPLDQSNQFGQDSGVTIQPGSIIPSENDCLIISGICSGGGDGATVDSIDSGFNIELNNPSVGGSNLATATAYLIQTSATAVNPTWTYSYNVPTGAVIASFKMAGGGGGGAGLLGTSIICL